MIFTLKRLLPLVAGLFLYSASVAAVSDEGWHKFELRGGLIALPATLDGIEGWAGLDMSNRQIVVNSNVSESYKQHDNRYIRSIHTNRRATKVSQAQLELLGASIPLRNINSEPLEDVLVILSWNIFGGNVVQIDYPNQRIRLLSKDAITNSKFGNIPARESPYGLRVELEIPSTGKPFWIELQPGKGGGLLTSRQTAERLNMLVGEPNGTAIVVNDEGVEVKLNRYTLPELKLGSYVLEEVKLYVEIEGESNPVAPASNKSIGFAGYDLFKHFVLTISFSDAQVHVSLPEVL